MIDVKTLFSNNWEPWIITVMYIGRTIKKTSILLKLICTVLQSDLYWIQKNSWLLCFEACRVKPVCCDIIFLCRVEHNIFYVAKHSRSRFDSRVRSLRRYATRFEVVIVGGLLFQLARVFHISNTSTHTVGLRNSAQSSEQDPKIQSHGFWIYLFFWLQLVVNGENFYQLPGFA